MANRCSLACLIFLLVCSANESLKTSDQFTDALFERIANEQVLKDQPYRLFLSWRKVKGINNSNIMFNFHGKFIQSEIRRLLHIFDNNMFVATLVTSSLLEAYKYGRAPRPSDEQLVLSINALKNFHDRNKPYNTSVMTFWQQEFNSSTNYWESLPENLLSAFLFLDSLPLSVIEALLKFIGMEGIAKYIESIMAMQPMLLRSFHIPPDFDDTFGNLALGSLLFQQREEFPIAWRLWESHNTNLTSVFDALAKYAYRPFSDDPNLNSIDPRTYFHIRGFLDKAKEKGQDVALVPTWVQSIDEVRKEYYQGVGMPFSVNNVDVAVAANTVFGITSAVLSGLVSPAVLEEPTIAKIYENSSLLIAFEIMNNFSGRADLALTYYPSRLEFYWFVARTGALLESATRNGTLPVKIMNTVYAIFRDVMEYHMTKDILTRAKADVAGTIYFDDFLGNGDVTSSGKPVNRGEDRIFTTSMAANALMYSWTYYDVISRKSSWKTGTPEPVRTTIQGCIRWLRRFTLSGRFAPWNAFFSGSVKGFETIPFWYPGNRFEYLNGTTITDWSTIPNSPSIYAVQGYVPADQYNAMLKEIHFGYPTPMTFTGYNNASDFFPLWSSDPYTYSSTLLAVSRFSNTLN